MSTPEEERRRNIMATLYQSDSWGENSAEVTSLARFLEVDSETINGDLRYLEGIDYVKLKGSRVALTETGYTVMNNREFSFCPHL